jgi:hypothetical protein
MFGCAVPRSDRCGSVSATTVTLPGMAFAPSSTPSPPRLIANATLDESDAYTIAGLDSPSAALERSGSEKDGYQPFIADRGSVGGRVA